MSFAIWSTAGPAPYDWERVQPLARAPRVWPYEEQAHEPGSGQAEGRALPARRWAAAAEAASAPRAPRVVLRAAELMAAPALTIRPDQTLGEALRLQRARRLRHLPVVNEDGRLVGILSDRDLLAAHATPTSIAPVAAHMASPVLSAGPDARLVDIARVLLAARVGCLPIVDEDGSLVGILTRSDILRALVHELPVDLRI
jgi:CBS domain-containing protein